MKNDSGIRAALINYIVFNGTSYLKSDLTKYSLTELVIIKTEIELQKAGKPSLR
jgi:hypothetical protein